MLNAPLIMLRELIQRRHHRPTEVVVSTTNAVGLHHLNESLLLDLSDSLADLSALNLLNI